MALHRRNYARFLVSRWPPIAAMLSMVVGASVLIGWKLNSTMLKTLGLAFPPMKVNTAFAFIAVGLALWLLHLADTPKRVILRRVCMVLVTGLGAVTLSQYLFGWNSGLDQFIAIDATIPAPRYPGRMAPLTSLTFMVLGGALICLDTIRNYRAAQFLAMMGLIAALLIGMGYLYRAESLYRMALYGSTSVSFITVMLFLVISAGILCVCADHAWMGLLLSDSAGGVLGRRLIPAAFAVPPLLGWFFLLGQTAGRYDVRLGIALFAIANVVIFTVLILASAASLYQIDLARQEAEGRLHVLYDELEGRVQERTAQLEHANRILGQEVADRKQAETALLQSEDRFAKAFRSSPAALTITRMSDSCFIDVNASFLSLFGYTRDEVIGHPSTEFTINPDPEARAVLAQQFREQGSVHNHELLLRTRAGEFRTILLSATSLNLANETYILTTMLDLTSRKEVEAALRDSEAKLRALFAVLPVGISILDRQRRIVEMNPALIRILRLSSDGLGTLSHSERSYIQPDGTRFTLMELPSRRAFDEQRAILDVEVGVVLETGQTIWTSVSAAPLPIADLSVVVVTTDITERRAVEANLKHERDLLQALMDHIPDTIYFKDRDSRFTRINRAQARVLGVHEPQDAIGKTDADFQAPHLAADFLAEEQNLLQTGVPLIDREEYNPTSNGTPRWFSATKVPMYDQQGRISGLIGISRDITERIKTEAALHHANDQLLQRINQMTILNHLTEQFQACVSIQEVYTIAATLLQKLFPQANGAVYSITANQQWVETAVTWGEMTHNSEEFNIADCWAIRCGQLHIAGAESGMIACAHVPAGTSAFTLCLPLLAQGEALGIFHLRLDPPATMETFDSVQQQVAQVAADNLALALANVRLRDRLHQQSIRDPLTGLFNRRYLEEVLDQEIRRADRAKRTVGVIMLDVDYFKRINDTYGHEAGDNVLRQLGRFLIEQTRNEDSPCRYGGEEFLLILPEATLEQTHQRAKQHQEAFRALQLHDTNRMVEPITLSFGVAAYPNHGSTRETIMQAVDAALYRAKREGRDRVVLAE